MAFVWVFALRTVFFAAFLAAFFLVLLVAIDSLPFISICPALPGRALNNTTSRDDSCGGSEVRIILAASSIADF